MDLLDLFDSVAPPHERKEVNEKSPEQQEWEIVRAKPTHEVPSGCLGPMVCGVVGICGRCSCMTDEEAGNFHEAMIAAQSPRNSHRVPDLGPRPIETVGVGDDAA